MLSPWQHSLAETHVKNLVSVTAQFLQTLAVARVPRTDRAVQTRRHNVRRTGDPRQTDNTSLGKADRSQKSSTGYWLVETLQNINSVVARFSSEANLAAVFRVLMCKNLQMVSLHASITNSRKRLLATATK